MKRIIACLLTGLLAVGMMAGCSKKLTPEEQAASEAAVLAQQLQEEETQTGLKRLISNNLTEYEQPFYDFVDSLQKGDAAAAAKALGVPNTFGDKLQSWVIVNNYETFQKAEMKSICLNSAKDGASAVLNIYMKSPKDVTTDTQPDYTMNVDYVNGAWALTPPTGVIKDYAFSAPTNKVTFEGTDLSSYAAKSAATGEWMVTLPRALDLESNSTYVITNDMGDYNGHVYDVTSDGTVNHVKCERDVKKRLCGVNELCCILYPLFKEMLTKNSEKQNQQSSGSGNGKPGNSGFGLPQNSQGQQNGSNGQSDPNQNGNGSQNGSGNAQNNSSNGNGNGKSVGSMTAEQLSEALKEAVKQIEQAAKNVGVNNLPDRHSNSITNQASKSKDAKKRESGKQGSGNNANGNGNGNSNSIANAPGANSGKSDLSAAKCDIKAIEKARKQEIATAQANNEANNQLAQEGAKIGSEIGTKISVRRAAEVPQSNIDTYNRLSAGLLSVTKNLERRLKTTIRDEENDDAVAGLPMGSRVEARLAYHQDGKIFSRKNFPRDNPRLAVGYLCDESGSMSDEAIAASVRTAIILQDLCERMELPCYVCGFTTGGYSGSVDIITYVDKNVDGKDKYRTTGMASRGGTPTVPAMKYMGKKLMKDSTEKKILIVSTDGCSGRGYGETVRDVIKKLQHDGVMVIGAGIGDSKPRIQEEFGSNFLDISNLDAMPKILCNIVKKNLV